MEKVLSHPAAAPLISRYGRDAVKMAARGIMRDPASVAVAELLDRCSMLLESTFAPEAPRVINATGVLIHTNLGRAPLSSAVRRAMAEAAEGYHAVELDLTSGKRGSRAFRTRHLAAQLLGAEDTLVVNNNAAAVLLALASVAAEKQVLVSRGELVAIGGSFKIPEILETSGAVLREVGTTNRTKIEDFERGFSRDVAALLTVHPSNYEVRGYSRRATFSEIARFCRRRRIPWIHDHGSGTIADLAPFGMPGQERATDALRAGASLVSFSGDKLFAGPQSGILAGRGSLIDRCRKHPLARAVRADKITLAGTFATVATWLADGPGGFPLYALAATSLAALRDRIRRVASAAPAALDAAIVDTRAVFGGGTTPERSLPSVGLALAHADRPPDVLAGALRRRIPPVIGRVQSGKLILDFRAVFPEEDATIAEALRTL